MAAAPVTAEIVAVGSELLTPHRTDTNSLWLAEQLEAMGVQLRAKHVVGDDLPELCAVLREALAQSRLVITSGGLGPTEDDLTRDAVAKVLRRKLVLDEGYLEKLKERFRRHGFVMAPNNRRQALRIGGAELVLNPRGSAPGQIVTAGRRAMLLLPGPPHEVRAVWDAAMPRLRRALGTLPRRVLRTRKLLITGLPESAVDHVAAPIYREARGVATTILCSPGQIELHLRAEGTSAAVAQRRADQLARALRAALGQHVFGEGDDTLERVVIEALRRRRERVALCESCTGGLLGHRLTQVPGCSDVLDLGVVAYANWAKVEIAGVRGETLQAHGAVSAEAAGEMARGVKARAGAAWGLAITGIAGPGGGSDDKPVGTTYVALAGDGPARIVHRRFPGGREHVKWQASQAALDLLRRALLESVG